MFITRTVNVRQIISASAAAAAPVSARKPSAPISDAAADNVPVFADPDCILRIQSGFLHFCDKIIIFLRVIDRRRHFSTRGPVMIGE